MDIAAHACRSSRLLLAPAVLATIGAAAVACSSPSSSTAPPAAASTPGGGSGKAPTAATATATATAPAVAGSESPPPGDIPDSTAFIAYRPPAGQYQVRVPEGWARTVSGSGVSFADKLNTISVTLVSGKAPTTASARSVEVPKIASAGRHFALAGVSTVARPAGSAVLIRYSVDSAPDQVTGKVYPDAVERYEFYRNGVEAIVTLSCPKGSDNVDAWRTVTTSFTWLQ
jgi:hypothetical protein